MPNVQGQVGPRTVADGGSTDFALDRQSSLIVTDGHGQRREATARGRVFVACTAAAGVAPGTAFSTTPPLSLYNPANSVVKLSILEVRITYVSGTLGSGVLSYAQVQAQTTTPSTGTALTPASTRLDATPSVGLVRQGSTHVGTPTLLEAAGTLTPALATTVLNPVVLIQDFLNGKYEVPQATAFVIQADAAAAGTSPLLRFAITWEEIPV